MLLFFASLLAVPLLHTGGLFTTGLAPIADADIPVAQRSVQACAKCHPKQLAEWQHSRHSRAWTNALFQREYKQQPLNWCVHCHAPLQSQFAQVQAKGGPLADEGVSCAVCHVRGGKLLARTRHADSPHDTVVSADFGSAEFCAGCHQFNFPLFATSGQVSGYSAFPMQDTVAQFQRGPYYLQGKGRCGDCHAQSPAGHTFPGAHDPQQLKQALSYSLCRTGSGLQLTLTNRGAGHNVPTGDVHRHIVARLWRSSSPEQLFELSLGRRYEPVEAGGKRTVVDTTLAPAQSRTYQVPGVPLGVAEKSIAKPIGKPIASESGSGDPLNFQLRYVYTIDEFPFPGHEVAEPTYLDIINERIEPQLLPMCAK